MTLSTIALPHTSSSPPSLWGNAQQLVVVVTQITYLRRGYLLAYGVDPAHVNPQVDTPVFERMLPLDGLSDFLTFLIDGDPEELSPPDEVLDDPILSGLAARSSGGIIANSVDVTNADPQPPGPKLTVVFALATSITTDHSVAAVDAYAA
jgi:hypothetical protein